MPNQMSRRSRTIRRCSTDNGSSSVAPLVTYSSPTPSTTACNGCRRSPTSTLLASRSPATAQIATIKMADTALIAINTMRCRSMGRRNGQARAINSPNRRRLMVGASLPSTVAMAASRRLAVTVQEGVWAWCAMLVCRPISLTYFGMPNPRPGRPFGGRVWAAHPPFSRHRCASQRPAGKVTYFRDAILARPCGRVWQFATRTAGLRVRYRSPLSARSQRRAAA